MREAQSWVDRVALPMLKNNHRFSRIELIVSTSETVRVSGELRDAADLAELEGLLRDLHPPCPVRISEIRDARGEWVESDMLIPEHR